MRLQSRMRLFRAITCPPFSDINESHLYWVSIRNSSEGSNKRDLQVRNTILSSRSDSLANPGWVSDKNGSVIHCCVLHTVLRLLTPTHASCQIFSNPHSASDVGFYIKCWVEWNKLYLDLSVIRETDISWHKGRPPELVESETDLGQQGEGIVV